MILIGSQWLKSHTLTNCLDTDIPLLYIIYTTKQESQSQMPVWPQFTSDENWPVFWMDVEDFQVCC